MAPLTLTRPVLAQLQDLKKEPGVSDRDISGLVDGGSYMSEARSWSDIPPCAADGGQGMAAVFSPGEKGRLPVMGELALG